MAIAYRVKERLRDFYRSTDPDAARRLLQELLDHCLKAAMPPEIQKLGRTIRTWFDKLCNYHLAKVTNESASYCTSSRDCGVFVLASPGDGIIALGCDGVPVP